MAFKDQAEHFFLCMGGIVLNAKDGKCPHGSTLKAWQVPMSKGVLMAFVKGFGILMGIGIVAVIAGIIANA